MNLDLLLQPQPPEVPARRYGTITGTDPLRVVLDGPDEIPLPYAPPTLATVKVGDRVLTDTYHRKVVILGVVGGPSPEPVVGRRHDDVTVDVTAGAVERYMGFRTSDRVSGGVVAVGHHGLLVPVAGWYDIKASVRFGLMASDGTRQIRLEGDVSGRLGAAVDPGATRADGFVLAVSVTDYIPAGDAVSIYTYSGDSGTIRTGTYHSSFLSLVKVG